MITRKQFDVLSCITESHPLVVNVIRGEWKWPEFASESTVSALVKAGALKTSTVGELGDYQVTFSPTERSGVLRAEYEAGQAKQRARR